MNAIHNFGGTGEEVIDLAMKKAEVLGNTVFISTRQRLFSILDELIVCFEPGKGTSLKVEALQTSDNFDFMGILQKAGYVPKDSW